jgi:hypothetical protein
MVFRDLDLDRLEGCNPRSQARKVNAMLDMSQCDEGVKPIVCEQHGDNHGTARGKLPTHLVVRWRGGSAPTVQPYAGHDVTFAFVMAEGMMGLRDGDAVILYALHWSQSGWGRA